MDSKKYIGINVHKESISIAVRNGAGKIITECVIETKASMILDFIDGCAEICNSPSKKEPRPPGCTTCGPHVTKLVVCDPRENAFRREGNQNDKIDARRLAGLLRLHLRVFRRPVRHWNKEQLTVASGSAAAAASSREGIVEPRSLIRPTSESTFCVTISVSNELTRTYQELGRQRES